MAYHPSNRRELNLVDYHILGVADLQKRLRSMWADFQQSVVDEAFDQW